MKTEALENLISIRDQKYYGDWSLMLKALKEAIKEPGLHIDSKKELRYSIQQIEICLNLRPKDGFKYINHPELHCRIPASLSIEDFRLSKEKIMELCELDSSGVAKNKEFYPAYIAIKEIIYMINTYGFNSKFKPTNIQGFFNKPEF